MTGVEKKLIPKYKTTLSGVKRKNLRKLDSAEVAELRTKGVELINS